jgi:putative sterol carrier protein
MRISTLMADPTRERCPDYTLAEFDNERIVFTVDGKTDEEAVEILRALWTIHHARDIGRWERQHEIVAEEEEQRREQVEQEAEQQCALQLEEEEEAKKEEKKKYKNKFAPIPDRPLLATVLLLLSQHALSKLRKGDYVPLHLFMNKGIREAEEDSSGDENLLTLVQTDKGPTFQTSASVKAKKHKVKDKALSQEEFAEANYRMLNAMRQQDWPVKRLDMVRYFWLALEGHSWRHDLSEYHKCTLLLYQGRVRRDWHKTLGTPDAFRLLPLQVGRLNDYHQELLDNVYAAKIEAM